MRTLSSFVGATVSHLATSKVRPGCLESFSLFLLRQCLLPPSPAPPYLRPSSHELESRGAVIRDAAEEQLGPQEQSSTPVLLPNGSAERGLREILGEDRISFFRINHPCGPDLCGKQRKDDGAGERGQPLPEPRSFSLLVSGDTTRVVHGIWLCCLSQINKESNLQTMNKNNSFLNFCSWAPGL